jgi:tetratricopeptide (TPR) repeat protein
MKPKRRVSEGLAANAADTDWKAEFDQLLENVKKALKHGWPPNDLRDNLKKLDRIVTVNALSLRGADELHYLKSKCILAEAYDYIGDGDSARKAASEGSEILEQLKNVDSNEQVERKILRERVRLCLDYVHAAFYRTYKYDDALNEMVWCREFVIQRLQNMKDFPCYGTLAKVEHNLGRIHMRRNEYEEAVASFDRSIKYYYERAERMMRDGTMDMQKLNEELSFSGHKAGICCLGLGWTNFLGGRIKIALHNNINLARHLLMRTKDALHTAYLDLLLGSVKRALAGRHNKPELQEAIRIMNGAYAVFKKYKHGPYMARASFELSLAYLYNGELDEAEEWAAMLVTISERINELRWRSQTLIVRSRIARESADYLKAETIASEALASAQDTNQVLFQIEAHIARGEARIFIGRISDARTDFLDALKLNTKAGSDGDERQSNPKVEAVCKLHLARCYIAQRRVSRAELEFDRWRELRGQIEQEIIQEIAVEVEQGIQDLKQDFRIPADSDVLIYETRKRELQQWLVERAAAKDPAIQRIADKICVSRETVHKWMRLNPKLRALLPKADS